MNLSDYLRKQYEFVTWADELCVAAARTVPAEAVDKDFGFSFGSVRLTLVHMMSAQLTWLDRLTVDSDPTFPDPSGFPSLDAVAARWKSLHTEWQAFLAGKTDADFEKTIQFKRQGKVLTSTVLNIVSHVFDHATHHRGQLNSLIKLAGGNPGYYGRNTWSAGQI
ncbi:MAG: DinB family protein [Tepidisphaeraceae bacterium]